MRILKSLQLGGRVSVESEKGAGRWSSVVTGERWSGIMANKERVGVGSLVKSHSLTHGSRVSACFTSVCQVLPE